ncbi:putative germin-like protein 12-4 [Hibiscus syriacus]|uniref:Germin-like protein n=1 Tax=Hibiscus syriacus TaxID=106335 RepID=A0A6A3CLD3_HIBSY|nr:putative germin-like protein 12-4 [Hibiscus syriacus]
MGITMARVDIAGNGLVRRIRTLEPRRLEPGDSFVFPRGLIHFLYNTDSRKPALTISGLSSQNPGAQIASRAAFVSGPPIPDVVLEKAF